MLAKVACCFGLALAAIGELDGLGVRLLTGPAAGCWTWRSSGVPRAVFTIPELTRVGLDEAQAHEQRVDVEVKVTDMSDWYSVERVGERHGLRGHAVGSGSGRRLLTRAALRKVP